MRENNRGGDSVIKRYKFICIIIMVLAVCACSGTPTQLGSPTTSTNEAYINADFSKGRNISAKKCGFQLLLFFPIGVNDRLHIANSLLISQADGDYISDVKVTESWMYGLIGTKYCTKLDATAYPPIQQ